MASPTLDGMAALSGSAGRPTDSEWPGQDLGLPEKGVDSIAGMGVRVGAFLIDIALSAGIAWLFTRPEAPKNWSAIVWAAITVLGVGIFGYTPGQALLGIRVAPLGRTFVGAWALLRTACTFVIVPVLITDKNGRGLHDRWCRTVVVRMR
jgi:uncharacterized RDD family membrane protein YckC